MFVHSATTLAIKLAGLESECEPKEKPYSCKRCEYSSRRAHILKRHVLTYSGERPFHCTHCISSFTQRGHFKEHMSTHSGERRFSCDQCNYSCIQANDIKKHMLQHFRMQNHNVIKCFVKFVNVETNQLCFRGGSGYQNRIIFGKSPNGL